MRNNVFRWMKLVALVLIMGGCFYVSIETHAAQGAVAKTGEILYVEYDAVDCTLGEAPIYTGADNEYGYLFGGWYTYTNNKYQAIKKGAAVPTEGKVYAKFVPAYVLSVKCQSFVDTTADSETTSLRIVSSIDSLQYRKVGFDLMKITKSADGTYTKKVLGKDGGQTTTRTYSAFAVYENNAGINVERSYTPQQVFGNASNYLTAWRIDGIKNEDFGTIYCIRPYWETMDGTTVYGLTKYAHIEDGYLGYINVPINLQNANDVAAGMLNVIYDKANLEFVDVERGRVFDDINYLTESDDVGNGIVKCVGSLNDMTKNVSSDDIYINLRFKAVTGKDFTDGINSFDFEVKGESFSDRTENLLEGSLYNVWNVKSAILK